MSAPQFRQPMRRCHASLRHQRSHVTCKTFILASAIRRFSPRQRTYTWRSPIRPDTSQQVVQPIRSVHFLALNMYPGNISNSTDQKLDRIISMMEHLLSSGEVQVNPAMDSSNFYNYGRYEDSHYYNVNGYENYHYSNYASPQPDFSRFMSHPQVPQHEGNQQFYQSLSLEDMVMQVKESVPECWQICNDIRKLDFSCPGSKYLVIDLDQYIASRQRKINEAELCSTQPTFNSEEDWSVDTLTNLEVKDDTQMEDYLIDVSEECEVFPIEPEIVIALNEGEYEMNIDVNSDKPEKTQIESEEDQPLLLVQSPTLPCTSGTPYKGVEVRERLQIFYNADTLVLDEPDTIDSFVLDDPNTIDFFVLEVPDELLNLKEGVHASSPKYVDTPAIRC
ncbi:hypothetical protein Syun_023001 [Stephania yunnanensis]|uniref:Uncharacterized protein n=1 Tax=Stephania yunnanensis TaxID=152371 RepID=A0AAP0F830_9MAGN